ncbi:MAG TPA: VCBS repeat-containing protein, partial [Planctomycetota bacterium]|nr:VCBS repeat-containing protein [Planctomycetota bacterium]
AFGDYHGSIGFFRGDGAGGLGLVFSIPIQQFLTSFDVANADGNGVLDWFVSATTGVRVVLFDDSASFTATGTIGVGGATRVRCADLNLDGLSDAVLWKGGSPPVTEAWLGQGNLEFTQALASAGSLVTPSPITDLSGDAVPDFLDAASGAVTESAKTWLGSGNGHFSASASVALAAPSTSFSVADVNSDGKEDAVATFPLTPAVVLVNHRATPAGVATFGEGTPSCFGRIALTANVAPAIGAFGFRVLCTNAPRRTTGLGLIGASAWPTGIDPFGFGTKFHVDLTGSLSFVDVSTDAEGTGFASLPIPNVPAFVAESVHLQALFLETPGFRCSSSTLGLASSKGLTLTFQP